MLRLQHGFDLGKRARRRFFAQDVFARAQEVARDGRVHPVGGADGHRRDFGVVQEIVVIDDGGAASVFFDRRLRAFGENVAEILDFRVGVGDVGGNMRMIGDISAADDCYFHDNDLSFLEF